MLAVAADSGTGLWDVSAGKWTGGTGHRLPPSDIPSFGSSNRGYLVSNLDGDQVQLRSVADGRVLFRTAADDPTNVALSVRTTGWWPSAPTPVR